MSDIEQVIDIYLSILRLQMVLHRIQFCIDEPIKTALMFSLFHKYTLHKKGLFYMLE